MTLPTRRHLQDTLRPLHALTPDEARTTRAAWLTRLRSRPTDRQTTGGLRDLDGGLCALGELADELVTRGYAAWEGRTLLTLDRQGGLQTQTLELPGLALRALGLRPEQMERVIRLNDRELMPWPHLAGRVERWTVTFPGAPGEVCAR